MVMDIKGWQIGIKSLDILWALYVHSNSSCIKFSHPSVLLSNWKQNICQSVDILQGCREIQTTYQSQMSDHVLPASSGIFLEWRQSWNGEIFIACFSALKWRALVLVKGVKVTISSYYINRLKVAHLWWMYCLTCHTHLPNWKALTKLNFTFFLGPIVFLPMPF